MTCPSYQGKQDEPQPRESRRNGLVDRAGSVISGLLADARPSNFAAVPVGQRWPVHTLMVGAGLVAFAKVIEWHTSSSASRVARDALTKAKR